MKKDIVLIPGALATPSLWYHQKIHFNEKMNFHYLNVLNSHSISEMALRFAEYSPDNVTLVGFSMGGYVALELFRHIPHKIEKLILINSNAKSISKKSKTERQRTLALIQKGKFSYILDRTCKHSIYDPINNKTLIPFLTTMAHAVGANHYMNQLVAIIHRKDQSDILSTISCPTLLIASKNDNVIPIDHGRYMAKHIKNSELIYVEDCGHMAMLEQPKALNNILSGWL